MFRDITESFQPIYLTVEEKNKLIAYTDGYLANEGSAQTKHEVRVLLPWFDKLTLYEQCYFLSYFTESERGLVYNFLLNEYTTHLVERVDLTQARYLLTRLSLKDVVSEGLPLGEEDLAFINQRRDNTQSEQRRHYQKEYQKEYQREYQKEYYKRRKENERTN